jgi:hypothetical protein
MGLNHHIDQNIVTKAITQILDEKINSGFSYKEIVKVVRKNVSLLKSKLNIGLR